MVPGTANFRDLGGLQAADGRRVVRGHLFRSDALSALGPEGRAALTALGVSVAIDLRSTAEATRFPPDVPCPVRHLPLWDGERSGASREAMSLSLSDRYLLLAQFAPDAIGAVVRALLTADAPTVVFCAAGKDRTGIVSALTLAALGVAPERLVDDYARYATDAATLGARLTAMRESLPSLAPADLLAEPATMAAFLDGLAESWGGLDAYLDHLGVDDAVRADARARLTEPA